MIMFHYLRSILLGIAWIAVVSRNTQNVFIHALGEKHHGAISSSDNAAREIEMFLQYENNDVECPFHIQGWRWHWLSLLRDSVRLTELTRKFGANYDQDRDSSSLQQAVDHVIFNYKALERIESKTFFPWLRDKLLNKKLLGGDTTDAFSVIIHQIDQEKQVVDQIATKMKTELQRLDHNGLRKLNQLSSELSVLTKSIKEKQDRYIVPALSKIVPSKEQKSFNTKVLRTLGLLESRIHLVGMHDAVYDKRFGNEKEVLAFESEIPVVARKMISRWKRTLYQPQAGALDEF